MDREESLFLTVSEDHSAREYPEYIRKMSEPFRKAGGMITVYEGVILGGGDKLFGLEELNLWLRRYRYAAYDMHTLLPIAHMCLEYAVRQRLVTERPGIAVMARQAAFQLLDTDPARLRHTSQGWMTIYWLTEQFPETANPESRRILQNFEGFEEVLRRFRELMEGCAACVDGRALVEQAVLLYKKVFSRCFAPDHSRDELPQYDVSDDNLWEGDYLTRDPNDLTEPDESQPELQYKKAAMTMPDAIELSEEALAAVPAYLAENFGPSYQTEKAMKDIRKAVCVDIHEDRKLLFTAGLPESAYEGTAARACSLRASRDGNLKMLEEHRDVAREGIRSIEQAFRNALNLKSEPEIYRSDRGRLDNGTLWKVGRCENPQLFQKVLRQDDSAVVVDLLIDASGSQSVRQSMVAMQSYLFSAALSRIRIPHRVMSYCTYGDHTVLTRFRDYDDKAEEDRRIFHYRATSNNRDGLALAAAGIDLRKRREDHKIMIVFSDGLPNDMVSGRVRSGTPEKYIGDAATRDTCFQVRKLRREGVLVIGIFLGEDDELDNERLIYGSSFLRIRRAEDFGGSAGKRLSETLLAL